MHPTERLKGIEQFVLSAQTGSFTAAAEKLNLTNSAVGKSVGRLEVRLGTRLFERTTRSLTLTDAGAAFYAICTRVLNDLADAEAVLSAHENEPVGRLKINVPLAFGHLHVMPKILLLAERHPGLLPVVDFTDRFVDLIEERVDLAVRITAADAWPDTLASHYIGSERLIICASPGFLARCGAPQTANDLQNVDTVLYGRADGTPSPWRLPGKAGNSESRRMAGRIVVGSAEAQVASVKAGLGIAQLATWLIRDELERGELVEILPDLSSDGLQLHLVWPRSRQLSPKVNAAIALFSDDLRIR